MNYCTKNDDAKHISLRDSKRRCKYYNDAFVHYTKPVPKSRFLHYSVAHRCACERHQLWLRSAAFLLEAGAEAALLETGAEARSFAFRVLFCSVSRRADCAAEARSLISDARACARVCV